MLKITAKMEYGCVAMLELAAHYKTGNPVAIRAIGEKHDIPPRFLVQILATLRDAGLVRSERGAEGGYYLVAPPDKISLDQVMNVIQGREDDQLYCCSSPDSSFVQSLFDTWSTASQILQDYFKSTTLAELLAKLAE